MRWSVGDNGQFKIAVLDRTGRVAQWTIQDDTISLNFQREGPNKARCVGLIPPTKSRDAQSYGL